MLLAGAGPVSAKAVTVPLRLCQSSHIQEGGGGPGEGNGDVEILCAFADHAKVKRLRIAHGFQHGGGIRALKGQAGGVASVSEGSRLADQSPIFDSRE